MQQSLHISASCVISKNKIYKNQQQVFDETLETGVYDFLEKAYTYFECNYPRFYKMDNLSRLGWLCSEIMLAPTENQVAIHLKELDPAAISVLLCNASSSLDTDAKYYASVANMASPSLFVYTLPNIVMGEMCIRNKWKGENVFFITDHFDPAFLVQQVSLLMQSPANEACVCGWVELLGNQYKAALFLVQHEDGPQSINFTPAAVSNIFKTAD